MAKKKKSKTRGGDARGYSKTAGALSAGTAVRKVEVTSRAHEGLSNLLDDLKSSSSDVAIDRDAKPASASAIDPTSKRFLKKVTNIHDSLVDYGFGESQIHRAVQTIGGKYGAEFSLELALDWLCLNLSSEELPSLFTEADVRIAKAEGEISVVKVNPSQKAAPADSIRDGPNHQTKELADMFAKVEMVTKAKREGVSYAQEQRSKDDDAEKANRAWLLQQYEYEDDSDASTSSLQPTERNGSTAIPNDVKGEEPAPSPEETRLAAIEKQLEEEKASLNDEACNYMRSKYDTAELKKVVKKLEQQAKGLRSKIEKRKATERSEAATADDDQERSNLAFSLFGNNDDTAGEDDAQKKSSVDFPSPVMSDSADSSSLNDGSPSSGHRKQKSDLSTVSIPKDWTGKTPKKILEEWCQKRRFPKPQFQKLPKTTHGCRVVIQRQPQGASKGNSKGKSPEATLKIEQSGPFHSFLDAQHFLATKALYVLNPTLPLYRLFPPVFRDLWRSWVDEVEAKKEAEVREKRNKKKAKIKNLVAGIPAANEERKESIGVESSCQPGSHSLHDKLSGAQPVVLDTWEDDSSNDDSEPETTLPVLPSPSAGPSTRLRSTTGIGQKLLDEFVLRQKTPGFLAMVKFRSTLPMQSYRDELLRMIHKHQVTILCADTGAGKTTQCPQYILEDALMAGRGDQISILCTQPRRISALSVAERVADEMCVRIGDDVGYHIRMEVKKSSKTRLLFCTTGVVLRRMQDDPDLTGVTHVVVDEVHERQWQIDFLLIALRRLIKTTRKDLKVVLMSATLDAKLFCNFFHDAPLVSVPGRTFPVEKYYLEDLLEATNHIIEEGSRCAFRIEYDKENTASMWVTGRGGEKRREVVSLQSESHPAIVSDDFPAFSLSTRRSMDRVDEQVINYDLIEDVLDILLTKPQNNDLLLFPGKADPSCIESGAILVFLPGLGEIRNLSERLKGNRNFGDRRRFDIIPMHSSLSPKDQKRAFHKPAKGVQKIILATNIAETSVTIPDVVCVIDSGLVREVRQDKRSGTSTLITDWCSKASAKQRSGRAGRVQAGIACKLYSSRTASSVMKDQAMPELQRVPLEEVCLSILAGGLASNCMEFLMQAPQPPSVEAVENALVLLEEVGAIDPSPMSSGTRIESLTPLGRHLSKLPVHVKLGKMLIFGALFKCLDKVLTIAASLSSKSPFSTRVDDAQQAAAAHRTFAHPTSDFLTICNVWDAYCSACANSKSEGRGFCDKNFLNRTALLEIGDMRRQFLDLLAQIGFVKGIRLGAFIDASQHDNCEDMSSYNANGGMENVLGAVICAGLYPNVAHAIKTPPGGVPALWHKKERVYFHSSSVNHKKFNLETEWVAFHEKFATSKTFVSATSLLKPFSLMLFGKSVVVRHVERKVIVDDWIELKVAAQTGVMFRELRREVEILLKEMIENTHLEDNRGDLMINGLVNLLSSE